MNTLLLIIVSVFGIIAVVFIVVISIYIFRNNRISIDINPDKYEYSYGDSVRGTVNIKSYKPLKLKKLTVGLRCTGPKNEVLKNQDDILEDNVALIIGEKDYDFYLEIPQNMGGEVKRISKLKWQIFVNIECEGLNNSKKIDIDVS